MSTQVNSLFNEQRFRVNVKSIQLKETAEENQATNERVFQVSRPASRPVGQPSRLSCQSHSTHTTCSSHVTQTTDLPLPLGVLSRWNCA